MSTQQQIRPWAETPAGSAQGPEEEVAGLFRRLDVAVHFNPGRVPLSALAPRRSAPRLRFALAAVALLLMGSAGAVAAVRRMPAMWQMAFTSWRASSPPPAAAPAPVAVPVPALVETPPPPEAETATPPAEVAVAKPVQPQRARLGGKSLRRHAIDRRALKAPPESATLPTFEDLDLPVGPAAAPPPPAESQLARETRLLQRAYSQLRSDDAAGALDSLDEYLGAHPLGLLRKEATSARVEALMKLRRSTEALVALRSFPFGDGARDAELRVLRGELTAGQDCQRALPDFEAVAEKTAVAGAVLERALYGRAACEAHLGQRSDAEGSFRAYLRQFPTGRFAAEANRQLGNSSK